MQSFNHIHKTLFEVKPELSERFGVASLGIFGSVVRGEDRVDSDVDLLVDFNRLVGIEFIDLADYLEQRLHRKVDLVSKNGLKPAYLQAIQKEIIYV